MVRVWDLEAGEATHELVGHRGGVMAVAVTPEGRRWSAWEMTVWSE